ncbi:ssDNA endodeoxyribonuclease [Mortierella antarctica]|nr:ssDNA endodeoxyribonuclease [Mortierella alpina]KAF9990309.1 ssDNA endodeoxyribonuclease [Mortierella antarctica]
MSQTANQCRFTGRIRNVRHLATLIKSVHYKDIAMCKISQEGLAFELEESRCLVARCLMNTQLFDDFKYTPPTAELVQRPELSQHASFSIYNSQQGSQQISQQIAPQPQFEQRFPSGYNSDGSVLFGVNLATLLNCLNMFGTAGGIGSSTNHGDGSTGGTGFASAPVTAIKLTYDGIGCPFNLTLEDDGVVTTCGIPTFDPEPPVYFDFDPESSSRIVMKAKWLEEGLRDLDATSDRVVFRFSPEIPHFRISSLGTIETLDVNYSQGDVLQSFNYSYDHPIEISYNFSHVLHVLRACGCADLVNISIDNKDFMRIQFLTPLFEHKVAYSEYNFAPLEALG